MARGAPLTQAQNMVAAHYPWYLTLTAKPASAPMTRHAAHDQNKHRVSYAKDQGKKKQNKKTQQHSIAGKATVKQAL